MRKIFSILLALTLLLCLAAGCGADKTAPSSAVPATSTQTRPDDTAAVPPETEPAIRNDILDQSGNLLGRIDARAVVSAADEGIFYSIFAPGENETTAAAQYRFFRASDGKDVLLGTLEDQGYEAVYTRTEMDGIVYTLALTGNPFDYEPDPLWLLAFDPVRETMDKFLVSEDASPYAAMTAADGTVLVMVHEMKAPKHDRVFAFDPASGALREVLSFLSEGDACESLRSLYADGGHLYLLRLAIRNGAADALYLDTYDGSYAKLSERSLQELIFTEEYPGILTPGDEMTELSLLVSGFAVRDGRYLWYENFGVTRALLDLDTGRNLFAKDDNYSLSLGGGVPVFYFFDLGQAGPGEDVQGLYVLQNGAVEKVSLTPPDDRGMIRSVSLSPSGTRLVSFSNSDLRDPGTDALVLWREP